MDYRKVREAVGCVLIVVGAVVAGSMENTLSIPYFAGFRIAAAQRVGSYTFDAVKIRQDSQQVTLKQWGFTIGSRHALVPGLQVRCAGSMDFGSTVERTIRSASSPFAVRHEYKSGSGELIVAGVKTVAQGLTIVALAGGMVQYLSMDEFTVDATSTKTAIQVPGFDGVQTGRWSPAAKLGCGVEFMTGPSTGMAFTYHAALSRPVVYDDPRDVPLKAIPYSETFLTHCVEISVLFDFEEP